METGTEFCEDEHKFGETKPNAFPAHNPQVFASAVVLRVRFGQVHEGGAHEQVAVRLQHHAPGAAPAQIAGVRVHGAAQFVAEVGMLGVDVLEGATA